jgi:hypothetical protein
MITALFGTKKGVNPHTRYPDAYYGRVFFDKPMFEGIELIAKIERTTKKKAARLLIERGFSSYMGKSSVKPFRTNWRPGSFARNQSSPALSCN